MYGRGRGILSIVRHEGREHFFFPLMLGKVVKPVDIMFKMYVLRNFYLFHRFISLLSHNFLRREAFSEDRLLTEIA